ncbi:MAG: FtsX-like permease family protein, partial [Peptostreptococcaceae bacterium]
DYINTLKPDSEVIMWGVIISIVVILSSILVIYNIFYLSIVTKVQEFGKLRAIGATKKQIKSIVLKEGMFLSLIAIPMGVLLGYTINTFIIGKLLLSYISVSKLPIAILVMAVSFLTVFISLLKPMKVASKVSIIDAIRYNGEAKNNDKTRKGYESINVKRLSYANLHRNKKRTYVTIISLSLSGIIFIVMASVMNSIDAEKRARVHFPQDIKIYMDGYTWGEEDSPSTELNMLQMKNPLGEDFRNKLKNIDGVTEIDNSKSVKTELKGYKTEEKYQDLKSIEDYDKKDLELYLEEGKIDLEKLKSGEEITINYPELAKELDIKAGDKVTLVIYDGDKKIEKEFKVQAITLGSGTFGIHNDAFDKMLDTDATTGIGIYVDKNKYESVKEGIKNLDKSNDYMSASFIDESIKSFELSIKSTKAMGYSLVIVVGVIGFMNLINSMITSIITRKKELGVLQAIGLTDKQLIKMLNIEVMFYTGTMLFTSLTLGSGLGYIAVQVFRRFGGSYASYTFPLVQIVIMTVCIIIAQLTLTYLISKNFNKESLIDRVRYSE